MTTLKAQMAADVTGVFLDTTAFAEPVTYTPAGAQAGFAAYVCCADVADHALLAHGSQVDQRRMQVLGSLAALIAGIETVTGSATHPTHGDQITFAQGVADVSLVGLWTVESAAEDNGGGVMLWLRLEKRQALASNGAVEVRG